LLPDGSVVDVQLIASSGDELFDNSAINAVNKASPFKMPSDKELAKEFRRLEFTFNPD
jgi:colicin import membrane protein